MASPEVLDFNRLLEPISSDRPAGLDLRSDTSPTSVYYRVKDARSTARAMERQIIMNGDSESDQNPDWQPVIALAPEVIAEQSKDLEIAAYLIEALVREDGFAGLRDGFRLTRLMVEQFSDDVFPQPDEDGVETRVAPLTGLNGEGGDGTLIRPILMIPVTDNTSVGCFSTADYQQAIELQRAPADARERRIGQGAVSMETFETAVLESSAQFYKELLDDISQCGEEFASLTEVLDQKYGSYSPPASQIRQAIESCKETVETVARDKLATLETEETTEAPVDAAAGGTEAAGGAEATADVLRSREDAFKAILKVADFFRRTEPHSPISYALDRIVRWGRLPLPELLKELIADEGSVQQMFNLVGIKRKEDEESE